MYEVKIYPGYYASSDGHIWSERSKKWLKPTHGYVTVARDAGGPKRIAVAKLVLMAHLDTYWKHVEYRDGDPTNAALSNVYWREHDHEPPMRGSAKMIMLARGKIAYVDADTYDDLSRFRWHATKIGVAARSASVKGYARKYQATELMHRRILGMSPNDARRVIHKNGNRLDNRRSNLKAT